MRSFFRIKSRFARYQFFCVRSCRYYNFLKADFAPWSLKEDAELLKLVKEHGSSNWAEIAKQLHERLAGSTERTRQQCRIRFTRVSTFQITDSFREKWK